MVDIFSAEDHYDIRVWGLWMHLLQNPIWSLSVEIDQLHALEILPSGNWVMNHWKFLFEHVN